MDEKNDLAEEIFREALPLLGDDRDRLLAQRCADDSELRSRVERLLRDHLEHELGSETRIGTQSPSSAAKPTCIGPYHLREKIGEGGFGVVFAAEQTEPVRRRVALKVLKAGMETKAVLARFEAERQALALMDHPAIAKVLDAGESELGHPYFVMELIHGEPITGFCDRQRLTTKERLDLFVQTCHAIQHAHTKGVIHRDVKPSNILVTTIDGEAVPKVIDFGIAKATALALTEKTVYTVQGQIIGTPAYMSPEQVEMAGSGVDTRTDVYSLGVLLYELLTGTLPFETKALRAAGLEGMRRVIREQEPPKPSTRISSLHEAAVDVAGRRRTDAAHLTSAIRGELDWIAMRALEKDPARRYQSANALAEDVERHLKGEAILAGPPSTTYHLRKLVARHQGFVAFVATVLILLLGFGVSMSILRSAAEEARAEAQARAEELELVTEFQSSMLAEIDAQEMGRALFADLRADVRNSLAAEGATPTELESALVTFDRTLGRANATDLALGLVDEQVLSRSAEAIEERFSEQPLVQAALQQSLADTYSGIGLYAKAMSMQQPALETRRRVLGDEHVDTLTSIETLGVLHYSMGEFDKALEYCRTALAGSRRVLGDEHPETLISLNNVAAMLESVGELDEALLCYREATEGSRRALGDEDPKTLTLINNVGSVLQSMGRLDEALAYDREAMDGLRRVLGDDHPETLISINNMGVLLDEMGRLDEALAYFREALEGLRRTFGDEHPYTLSTTISTSNLLREQDKPDQATELLAPAEAAARRVFTGGNDYVLGIFLTALGRSRVETGAFEDAEVNLREAWTILSEAANASVARREKALTGLVELYETWHAAAPGAGHDEQAAAWQTKLSELRAPDDSAP